MDLKLPGKHRVALWVYLVVDAALILVAFILGFISMMASRTEPAQFGFFCDDESIRYPVKDDTFTDDLVSALSFTVPLLLFIVQEGCTAVGKCWSRRGKQAVWWQAALLAVVRVVHQELLVLLAMSLTSVITEVGKVWAGRLRPYFLLACNPDYSLFNCTDDMGNPQYIRNVSVCHPDKPRNVIEARKSWPSGHASSAFCGMVFAMLVAYHLPLLRKSIAVRTYLILGFFLWAFIVGLSRISDYFHHPEDVLAGAIVGAVTSLVVFYSFMYEDRAIKYFNCTPPSEKQSELQQTLMEEGSHLGADGKPQYHSIP